MAVLSIGAISPVTYYSTLFKDKKADKTQKKVKKNKKINRQITKQGVMYLKMLKLSNG